jgi:ESCRT-I complex subunit TSG101
VSRIERFYLRLATFWSICSVHAPARGQLHGAVPPYVVPAVVGVRGYPSYPPTSNMPYPSYTPYPTPYPPYSGSGYGGPSPVPERTGTIKDEHIRESLLTAIEEKLLRRMKEQFQQNQAELETLQRTQDELKQGKMKLNTILSRLEKEQVSGVVLFGPLGCEKFKIWRPKQEKSCSVVVNLQSDLDKNITLLKDKEQELDKAIERLSSEEEIDVDDAVTTTAPLYKQ